MLDIRAFPTICDMRVQHTPADAPRARRWKAKQAHPGGVVENMRRLDALTVEDVVWTPYTSHIVHREFDEASLFSSHMWRKTLVARHLPKRCLRKYEYVQRIPQPVMDVPTSGIDKWFQSNIIVYARVIRDIAMEVQHPM